MKGQSLFDLSAFCLPGRLLAKTFEVLRSGRAQVPDFPAPPAIISEGDVNDDTDIDKEKTTCVLVAQLQGCS